MDRCHTTSLLISLAIALAPHGVCGRGIRKKFLYRRLSIGLDIFRHFAVVLTSVVC